MAAISSSSYVHSVDANEGRTAAVRPPRVEVVAITSDDLLLEQIGQALDGESIIRPADTPAEAREITSPHQPCVVLLDARGHDDLARVVGDLQSLEGARVVLVLAPAEAGDDVARAVRGSATFAVLTLPLMQAQAAAVLAGACEESLARHALLAAPPAAPESMVPEAARVAIPDPQAFAEPREVKQPREHVTDPASSANSGGRQTRVVVVASLALLVLLAAGGAWYWKRTHVPPALGPAVQPIDATPQEVPAVATAIPEALQEGSVDELLESARAAMRARRYTDPEGQNALNYYRSVLAHDSENGEAREGLERVAAVLHDRVDAAVEQRRFDEASRTLAQLRSIRADDPAIARYEATVVDARIRKAVEELDLDRAREMLGQAAKARTLSSDAISRWQSELDQQQGAARAVQLAELVSLRIKQGKLVDPANDSAKHYLAQLRRLPGDAAQRATLATTELQQACLDKLKDSLAKSQRADAERWKTEARALGVSAAEIAALQRDVSLRTAQGTSKAADASRVAQLVQDRIADNRLLEPAGDSALFHLNALRALDPSSSVTAASERALSVKLLEQGRAALADRRLDAAQAHASAARQLGVNLDGVASLERDIVANGAASSPAAQRTAGPLVRTRYVAPDYPINALKQHVQGSVRVSLTVDDAGRVRDAAVVQSNPPGVFDAAAVTAVRKWRFKPIGEEDSGVTATVTVEIAFRPEDVKK